jgi:hypothetical protein
MPHFLQEPKAVDLYFRVVMITISSVEKACFWTLFGPYVPDRSGPRGNGPTWQISYLAHCGPPWTAYN